jgi:putative aminopeptidase FrvX
MLSLIRDLCGERGISGDEGRVRARIARELEGVCSLSTDALGNLIAVRQGRAPAARIALFAHMDEVGMLVTRVTDEGLLRFSPIGIGPLTLHGRRVRVGDRAVPGVVGSKVWHHLEKEERDAEPKSDGFYIDIGASCREQALSAVSVGDAVTFDEPFSTFGEERIVSRALDNRVGCALLIRLLQSDCPVALTGVFTCGEEASMFGASAAATAVAPGIAVIVETTTAGDVEGAPADRVVCALKKGPVVSFADRGALYDRELYALAFSVAEKNGIPVQAKQGVFGGNEARAVSRAGAGARVLAVSVPCRNLHSASCVAAMSDIEDALRLLSALILALAAL